MARYRIVCTTQVPVNVPRAHRHIVAVGTGTDPDQADKKWTRAEVLDAMDEGDTFYTKGVRSGKTAEVVPVNCGACGHRIIRSTADAVADNNLDNLRECNWKA